MASEIRVNSLTNRSGLSTVSITDTGVVIAGMVTATTGNFTQDGIFGGNLTVTGNVSVAGTVTYEDVTNVDSVGLGTFQNGLIVNAGTASTALVVNGDARVTGILTIGTSSITLDGSNNQITANTFVGNVNTTGVSTFSSFDYAAIDKSISDTAVDVFIYNTRNDSDGGAWRKRTQHTSWYNDGLNTQYRGSRREFPAVAVIVATSTTIKIYDGDDPDMPLWMFFDNSSATAIYTNSLTSVSALNGKICWGMNSSPVANGFTVADFITDKIKKYTSGGGGTNHGNFLGNIADRNDPVGWDETFATTQVPAIVHDSIHDVAMTVLPNAPIDSATGLPIPTIAIATYGGVSVIKDDGTVVDTISSLSGYTIGRSVEWSSNNDLLFVMGDSGGGLDYFHTYDGFNTSDNTITIDTKTGSTKNVRSMFRKSSVALAYGVHPFDAFTVQGSAVSPDYSKLHVTAKSDAYEYAIRSPQGLTHISENPDSSGSLVSYATTSYATGWLHGDIKGAFLSDTDATNVTGSELVTNGTFDSNYDGWTLDSGASGSVSSGQFTITSPTSSAWSGAYTSITTIIGKRYCLTADIVSSNNWWHISATDGNPPDPTPLAYTGNSTASNTKITLYFTAVGTTTYISVGNLNTLNATVTTIDNVSVRIAEEDRSVNNKGLQVFGTITKTAVATGAELVAYSGWSSSNYLSQPYNSDIDVGTGDFSIVIWAKADSFDSYNTVFAQWRENQTGTAQFSLETVGSTIRFYVVDSGSYSYAGGNTTLSTGIWYQFIVTRKSGLITLYVNGVPEATTDSYAGDLTARTDPTTIGVLWSSTGPSGGATGAWKGSLTLCRFSASAPSAEQVKKIYEDEKVLFQENAACTLYGSSDAVTALAYDKATDLLHVGTSSGRSDFQGLRRINNTTTAVTTAITAYDEFIIEQ